VFMGPSEVKYMILDVFSCFFLHYGIIKIFMKIQMVGKTIMLFFGEVSTPFIEYKMLGIDLFTYLFICFQFFPQMNLRG